MPYCAECGQDMGAGGAFCPSCGAAQGAAAPVPVLHAPGPFSIGEAVRYGWEAMKRHLGLFLAAEAFLLLVYFFFMGLNVFVEMTGTSGETGGPLPGVLSFCVSIVDVLVTLSLQLGLTSLTLLLHDTGKGTFAELFTRFRQVLPYFAMSLLMGLAVGAGIILLIVPGIYWAVCFSLGELSLVDRRLGPIEALKRSIGLTRGHRRRLFILFLSLLLINLAGALCLLVGLFFTIPVSMMAMVFAYRRLEALAPAPAPPPAPRPITA